MHGICVPCALQYWQEGISNTILTFEKAYFIQNNEYLIGHLMWWFRWPHICRSYHQLSLFNQRWLLTRIKLSADLYKLPQQKQTVLQLVYLFCYNSKWCALSGWSLYASLSESTVSHLWCNSCSRTQLRHCSLELITLVTNIQGSTPNFQIWRWCRKCKRVTFFFKNERQLIYNFYPHSYR